METRCEVHLLGSMPYLEAWELQNRMAEEIAAGSRPPALLLLEHPHTFTFGRSGRLENLLWDEAELARRGIEVHWVDRGGDITYHGPGQLVGYPLLQLAPLQVLVSEDGKPRLPQADYTGYLRTLEEMLIYALKRFGVNGECLEGKTGVWITRQRNQPPAKIAAIGVKVDARGVSRHGFALNVNPVMSYWDGIIGCGLEGYPQTSLAELLEPAPEMSEVIPSILDAFGVIFEYQISVSG